MRCERCDVEFDMDEPDGPTPIFTRRGTFCAGCVKNSDTYPLEIGR